MQRTQKRAKESESKYIQTIEGVKKELHVLREKFKRFVPLDLTVFPDFMALNRRDGDKDLLEAINSKMPAEGFKSVPYKSAIAAESEVKTLKSANTSLESALEGLKQDLARAQEEKRAQSLEHQQQLQKLRDMQIAQLSSATESRKAGDDTGNISVTTKKPIETFNFFDDATPPATRTNSFGTTATPTPSLPGTVLFSPAFSTNNTSSNSNSSALDLLIGISNEQRTEPAKTEAKRSYKMVVTDEETGTQSASLGFSYDDKEREKLLMEHYEQALAQVTKRAQLADRKAAESQLGYSSVQAELANMSAELTASKGECAKTEQALAKAKSDLESTRQNYEGQMIALTEHIGGLNDTVAKLDEEVTRLKGVKIQCGTCHKWNTLGYLLTSGMNGKICGNGNHPTLSFMK